MKTQIKITGQPQGNRLLLSHLCESDEQVLNLPFGNFLVTFPTKGEAVNTLSQAYRAMKSNEPDYVGISYARAWGISYDASQAIIVVEY